MTLDELIAKVPEQWRPVAAQYGPALLAMSAEDLWAWIDLLVKGYSDEAYRMLLEKLGSPEVIDEWVTLSADWQTANAANAARVDLQRKAILAILQVLLAAALAMVGL